MELKPIGYLQSCFKDRFGTPRQSGLVPEALAFLRLLPEWQPELSLSGAESFSHLWILFEFHKNTHRGFHAKVHPPRMGGESIGVFATRSPHRPNSIGLSLAELVERTPEGLWLRGLDVIDGTPVFDIKPYLPEVESKPQARAGWTEKVGRQPPVVYWTPSAEQQALEWGEKTGRPWLVSMIENTLKLDPRPLVYKAEDGTSKHREIHAVRLFEGDVRFRFKEAQVLEVLEVLPTYHPAE